jgi:hypothetical protein
VKDAAEELKKIIQKDVSEDFSIPVGYDAKRNLTKKIINDTKIYVYRYNAKSNFVVEAMYLLGVQTSFDALLGSFSVMGILNEETKEIEVILFNTTNSYSGDFRFWVNFQPAIRGQASIPVPFSTVGQKLYLGKIKL